MAILVTGGAGYIGSVTVERLCANREDVVVLDDLVYGPVSYTHLDVYKRQGAWSFRCERSREEGVTVAGVFSAGADPLWTRTSESF